MWRHGAAVDDLDPRRRRGRRRLLCSGLAAVVVLSGLTAAPWASAQGPPERVTIRRTAHGVPHIEASSYRGLGYGYGYAFARDNICTIADDYVTVNAQRSRANEPDSWWAHPFDPADPVNTPNTLVTAQPGVPLALGDAIADLNAAKVPLDAAVGDVQHIVRAGRRIPIHGGPGDPHGQFNAIESEFVPGQGFGEVVAGTSYAQVVTWNDGPCPDAATILSYSQSTNPRSPFFADQGPLFSRKEWVPVRFCRGDVLRHTLSTTVLHAPR